jgi:hypothetical protein
MTTQELYNKVLKGDVTQSKFLYEVRRDVNLPFITSWNTFKDTVKILKNRGIVTEKKIGADVLTRTIDQVNPYEYTRGMDFELGLITNSVGNRVADNAGDSMHIEDITPDDVVKAQNKVLKNLTKNQNYYSEKLILKMNGEDHAMEEITDKVIAKIAKDAKKNNKKFIREHGEDAERIDDMNISVSQLENKLTREEDGEFKLYSNELEAPDKFEVEKLGQAREEIYEKYASKAGIDVNELKDKVEAYKAQKEAIEVEDEDTAIAVQKKSPDADVKIVDK